MVTLLIKIGGRGWAGTIFVQFHKERGSKLKQLGYYLNYGLQSEINCVQKFSNKFLVPNYFAYGIITHI